MCRLARPRAGRKAGTRVLRRAIDPALGARPGGIEVYSHLLKIFRRQPFRGAEVEWLEPHCDKIAFGRRRWNRHLVDRRHLYIVRPDPIALRWLARQHHLWLNYCELALDWTFATEREREAAYAVVDRCFYRKYHRPSHFPYFERRTKYDSPRNRAHVVALYDDRPSRVTGEVYCVHLEWRTTSARALRRIGIHSIADLIDFDHYGFWRERLLLWEIDRDRLLTMYIECSNDTTLQGFTRKQIARRLFGLLPTTQQIIDALRNTMAVRRTVIEIDVEHLLPPQHDSCVDKPANPVRTASVPATHRASTPRRHPSQPLPQRRKGTIVNVSYADGVGAFTRSRSFRPVASMLTFHAQAQSGSITDRFGRQHRPVTASFGRDRYGFLWQHQ